MAPYLGRGLPAAHYTGASRVLMTTTEVNRAGPPDRGGKPPARSAGRGAANRNYTLACVLVFATLVVSAAFNGELPPARTLYVCLLFAVCAWPLFHSPADPRQRILAIFMGCYLLIFGMATYFAILTGRATDVAWGGGSLAMSDSNLLNLSDIVVILGALCFLTGYFLTQKGRGRKRSQAFLFEWRFSATLKMAVLFWGIGFLFMLAYDTKASIYYVPEYVYGLPTGVASNLRMLAPLGAMMLIYLAIRDYSPKLVWTVLITIMTVEFLFGFIVSSKEISFRISVLLLLALFFIKGRVSYKIIGTMLLVSIPYLLFFNAYRMQIMEGKFADPAAAFEQFDKNLDLIRKKASQQEDVTGSSLDSLRQRIDGKVYIDIIVGGTSAGTAPLLYGETLKLFFSSFIPRVLWPQKPNISTGQMFNQAFNLSASRYTFVPTTQLGDLYWNFAVPGVVVGMTLMGMLFARLGGMMADGAQLTLPRFIIMMLCTYFLAIRFEGNIAAQYSTVIRLVVLMWLVDRFLRFMGASRRPVKTPANSATAAVIENQVSAKVQSGLSRR